MTTLCDRISHLHPCDGALSWLINYDDAAKAWLECPRGDWMLWLLDNLDRSGPWSNERKRLTLCAMDCALLVKHLWPKKYQEQIEKDVDSILAWARGEAPVEDAQKARTSLGRITDVYTTVDDDVAYSVVAYAAVAAVVYAADYAADTAFTAYNTVDAVAYATADAAFTTYYNVADAAVYDAAAADVADAARVEIQKKCADVIRGYFPSPPSL